MLALGIILVLVAAAVVIGALFGGSAETVTFDLGVVEVQTTALIAFLIGAATLLVFVVGLELIRQGVRRANRRRKDRKELSRLTKQLEDRDTGRSTGRRAETAAPEPRTTAPSDTGTTPGTRATAADEPKAPGKDTTTEQR